MVSTHIRELEVETYSSIISPEWKRRLNHTNGRSGKIKQDFYSTVSEGSALNRAKAFEIHGSVILACPRDFRDRELISCQSRDLMSNHPNFPDAVDAKETCL